MATAAEMLTRAIEARDNILQDVGDIVQQNIDTVVDFVRKQLYSGKDRFGNSLSPKYSEDPYFKTLKAAQDYAAWKQLISPDPERSEDTPNLFIRGDYHQSIDAQVVGTEIQYRATDHNAADIEAKFGGADTLYGLDPDNMIEVRQNIVMPLLRQRINLRLTL